jgi:hypothetical protein
LREGRTREQHAERGDGNHFANHVDLIDKAALIARSMAQCRTKIIHLAVAKCRA